MARIARTFTMDESAGEASARFSTELSETFYDWGFRLEDESPEHLAFRPRFLDAEDVGVVLMIPLAITAALGRLLFDRQLEVDFTPNQDGGCTVEVYGRARRKIATAIELLGHKSHWPINPADPDWLLDNEPPVDRDDEIIEAWEGEDIHPEQLDRITRRALKHAGRLK
jgi:hypothetical protein